MDNAELELSVTIPAFNEVETLGQVVKEAVEAAALCTDSFELLIVDDGSRDGTAELADQLANDVKSVRVVHHDSNRGFSGAMRTCVAESFGKHVYLGPADGQARFEDLERFLKERQHADLIFSYRIGRDDPIHRKFASKVWYAYIRLLFGVSIPEFSSSFLFDRNKALSVMVAVRDDGSNFLPMLYVMGKRAGLRVTELGTVQQKRRGGKAKGSNIANTLRTMSEDLSLWWRHRIRRSRPQV